MSGGDKSPAPSLGGGGMTGESSDSPERGDGGSEDQISAFIPKDALGGRTYEPGDTITMTVKSVDPETGEVEAECCGPEDDRSPGESPSVSGMDYMGAESE